MTDSSYHNLDLDQCTVTYSYMGRLQTVHGTSQLFYARKMHINSGACFDAKNRSFIHLALLLVSRNILTPEITLGHCVSLLLPQNIVTAEIK